MFAAGEADDESHAYASDHSGPNDDSDIVSLRYQTCICSHLIAIESGDHFPRITICPQLLD